MPVPRPAEEVLYTSRDAEVDSSKETTVRKFHVFLPTEAALTDGTLPQIGDIYPGGNINTPFPLILNRYRREGFGNGTDTWVYCYYTNDRSGRLNPAPDRTHNEFQTSEFDNQDTTVKIPTIMTYPLKVSGAASAGQPSDTRVGETSVYEVAESRTIYHTSVVVQGFVNAAQWHLISEQNNTLHKIQGKWYLFKAGKMRQTEKAAWETTYTWFFDPGTATPSGLPGLPGGLWPIDPIGTGETSAPFPVGNPTDNRNLYVPPATFHRGQYTFPDPQIGDPHLYVRSPYHTLSFYLDAQTVPHWTQVFTYRVNGSGQTFGLGWQTLPGVPDL